MHSGPQGALAVVQMSSIGAGYRLMNSCLGNLRALELIPLNEGVLCLVLGPADLLLDLIRSQRSATLVAADVIENADPRVLNGFYALNTQPVCELVLTVEASAIGYLFKLAHLATSLDFEILEFRSPRAGQVKGLLSLTLKAGSIDLSAAQDQWVSELILDRSLDVEKVTPVSEALRSYFPN